MISTVLARACHAPVRPQLPDRGNDCRTQRGACLHLRRRLRTSGPSRCRVDGERDLELDAESGLYRIKRILRGHNEEREYRAPLTEIGVDAREGDYLLEIDGKQVQGTDNPYRMLRHKASRPVEILLNDRPSPEGARKVVYQPISDESNPALLVVGGGQHEGLSVRPLTEASVTCTSRT